MDSFDLLLVNSIFKSAYFFISETIVSIKWSIDFPWSLQLPLSMVLRLSLEEYESMRFIFSVKEMYSIIVCSKILLLRCMYLKTWHELEAHFCNLHKRFLFLFLYIQGVDNLGLIFWAKIKPKPSMLSIFIVIAFTREVAWFIRLK